VRIHIDRNIVELVPESPAETQGIEILWRKLIDCVRETRKLVPIGEYIPGKSPLARFVIEGEEGGPVVTEADRAEQAATYVCTVCNKYWQVEAGEQVPLCCGKKTENMDS